jgi:predicted RNA-binding Zn-ribbon protein involved in translation (DUF1610 family)
MIDRIKGQVAEMKRNSQSTDKAQTTEDQKQLASKIPPNKNKESIKTLDTEDKIELERREAYIEPHTRNLLREILEHSDKDEITPKYVHGEGFVYQTTNSASSGSQGKVISKDLLENLVRLDILKKAFYDSVSVCPNCESTTITLHNRCPKCKSHNVEKTSLTEHIPCGYINQRDKYIDNCCPKCGEPLIEGQYRNMGRWYVCQECEEKFENPESDIVCRSCTKNFTIKEAKPIDIPKFSLNLQRKKEIRQNVASLENIQNLLGNLGFSIEIPGLVIGQKSGMQHHFSLIAKKIVNGQEKVIALDHSVSESEVSTSPLILYLYKTSEVKVDIPIFVAIPQLNETARKIAQGHNILLIEGSTEEKEVMAKLKSEIERSLDAKPQDNSLNNQSEESKPLKKSFMDKFMGKKK